MAAVIGALRAELSATIAKFQEDMKNAGAAVREFATKAEAQGKRLQRVGAQLSVALTAPLVAFGVKAVQAATESAQALGQLDAALKSTEHQAGRTLKQLQAQAKALESISTFDDDDILKDVTTNLTKFGNVVGDVFDRAQVAIVDMAARTGDLAGAAQTVGRALNDPIQGITALTRAGVQFTNQEKEKIKALITSGRGIEAQALILGKLEKAFGGAAKAARDASPTAEFMQSWREFMEVAGALIAKILGPLTKMLKGVLDAFNTLSPAVQQTIVYTGLFVAAIGPLLTIIGSLVRVVAFLTPAIAGLGAVLATISAPVWAIVAAVTAAVAALLIFWRAVGKLLQGDFSAAWEEAKKTARDMWNDLTQMFAKEPIQAPIEFTADGKPIKPGKTNFSIPSDKDGTKGAFPDEIHVTPTVDLSEAFTRPLSQEMMRALDQFRDGLVSSLQAAREKVMTQEELVDLHERRGDAGVLTPEERRRTQIARDLEMRQIDAEERIADLQAKRREQELLGETEKVARIEEQIILETQLADLLKDTTVDQIRAAERLQDTFDTFFSDVTNEFTRMAKEGKFTFAGLREAIREMLIDAFVKPHIEQAGGILKDLVTGGLKALGGSLFGGGEATFDPGSGNWTPGPGGFPEMGTGGFVPPGEWAVAGDQGEELVFGGKRGATVFSNEDSRAMMGGGGTTIIQNIRTQDVNSFQRTQRQLARSTKRALSEA